MKKQKKKRNLAFCIFYAAAKLYVPKLKVRYLCEPPEQPCIYVSNHAKIYGPVSWQIYGENVRIWTAYDVIEYPASKEYMYGYVLGVQNKKPRFLYRAVSAILGKLINSIVRTADILPVYFGKRDIIKTLKHSVQSLIDGENLVIMPECDKNFNDYIFNLFDGFVSVGKYYCKETGKLVSFYPSYVCPEHKVLLVGQPISYDPTLTNAEISRKLRDSISALALSLPPHKPIKFI